MRGSVHAVVQLADREFQLVVAMATTSRARVSPCQSQSLRSSSFRPEAALGIPQRRFSHPADCAMLLGLTRAIALRSLGSGTEWMSTRWFEIRSTRQGTSARMRDHSAALETVVMAMAFMQMSSRWGRSRRFSMALARSAATLSP